MLGVLPSLNAAPSTLYIIIIIIIMIIQKSFTNSLLSFQLFSSISSSPYVHANTSKRKINLVSRGARPKNKVRWEVISAKLEGAEGCNHEI